MDESKGCMLYMHMQINSVNDSQEDNHLDTNLKLLYKQSNGMV